MGIFRAEFFQLTDLGEMPSLRLILGETPSLGVFFRLGTFQLADPGLRSLSKLAVNDPLKVSQVKVSVAAVYSRSLGTISKQFANISEMLCTRN